MWQRMGRNLRRWNVIFRYSVEMITGTPWLVSPQIENASDVLILPLERFRKEQIGAAKVRAEVQNALCCNVHHSRKGLIYFSYQEAPCSKAYLINITQSKPADSMWAKPSQIQALLRHCCNCLNSTAICWLGCANTHCNVHDECKQMQ